MRALPLLLVLASAAAPWGLAQTALEHLTVENRTAPLGIDVPAPRFGWRMSAAGAERGVMQTAYRVVVREPGRTAVWDSGVVRSQESQNIAYKGRPLTLGNIYFNGNLSDLKPVIKSSTIGVLGSSNINDNVFLTNIQNTGFYFQDDAVRTNGQLDYSKQRNDPRINLSQNIRTLPSRVSNFRNQGITLLDLSMIKNFDFGERVKLQFRAEAINALNKAHFSGPVLSPRDSNFGRVTSTSSPTLPREFQLGLRLVY